MGTVDRRRTRRRTGSHADGLRSAAEASLLLGELPAEDRTEVVRAGRGVRLARGGSILGRGQDAVALVLSGVAASRSTTTDGSHLIHALLGPGDTHGVATALRYPEASDELLAITSLEALVIPGGSLRELVDERHAVARACLAVVAEEQAHGRGERTFFSSSSTSARLEQRLIELAERYGRVEEGRIRVGLPLTQDELASWAQTSRESCAKALHDLRIAGIIATGRRELIIQDLAALRARRRRTVSDPTVSALLRPSG